MRQQVKHKLLKPNYFHQKLPTLCNNTGGNNNKQWNHQSCGNFFFKEKQQRKWSMKVARKADWAGRLYEWVWPRKQSSRATRQVCLVKNERPHWPSWETCSATGMSNGADSFWQVSLSSPIYLSRIFSLPPSLTYLELLLLGRSQPPL